jgi:hypothetical protein
LLVAALSSKRPAEMWEAHARTAVAQ